MHKLKRLIKTKWNERLDEKADHFLLWENFNQKDWTRILPQFTGNSSWEILGLIPKRLIYTCNVGLPILLSAAILIEYFPSVQMVIASCSKKYLLLYHLWKHHLMHFEIKLPDLSNIYTGAKTINTCCYCWQWPFEEIENLLLKLNHSAKLQNSPCMCIWDFKVP